MAETAWPRPRGAQLRADGSAVTVIVPYESSATAIGANPLDPATRTPAASAGLAQGRAGLPDAVSAS